MECKESDLVEVESDDDEDLPTFIKDMNGLVLAEPLAEDDVGDRCFSLLGGRVIFGIVLGELVDSFLVALASTLVNNGKEVEGKLITATPVIRLFKSGVAFVSTPELEHRYLYYRHISGLTERMPGFFNPERVAKMKAVASAWSGQEELNRLNSPSDSTSGAAMANSGQLFPYTSTTRH